MDKRKYTIEEIRELLLPLLSEVPVSKAVLFGSYARNEATETSDIDIFIDSNGKLNDWSFYEFCDQLEECVGKKVDVIERVDLEPSSSLYQTIELEGITIYG